MKLDDLSRYVIDYVNDNKLGIISYYKLHNLLAIIQAHYMLNFDRKCFKEGYSMYNAGAWVDGVDEKYSVHGGNHIYASKKPHFYMIGAYDRKIINEILDYYAPMSNLELVRLVSNSDKIHRFAEI